MLRLIIPIRQKTLQAFLRAGAQFSNIIHWGLVHNFFYGRIYPD